MKDFKLSDTDHEIYYQKIKKRLFKNTSPVQNPTAIILGGQPGAGKSGLIQISEAEIPNKNVVKINGDDLRLYHPEYKAIFEYSEKDFATLTDPDSRVWTKRIFDEAIADKRNIIFEGTMRQAGPITETMHRLKQEGYEIHVTIMAVHERESVLGIFERYASQKEDKDYGRWTPLTSHDEAYKGMLTTIDIIEKEGLAAKIDVYSREGLITTTGPIREALEEERNREFTPEQKQAYLQRWQNVIAKLDKLDVSEDIRNMANEKMQQFTHDPEINKKLHEIQESNAIQKALSATQQYNESLELFISTEKTKIEKKIMDIDVKIQRHQNIKKDHKSRKLGLFSGQKKKDEKDAVLKDTDKEICRLEELKALAKKEKTDENLTWEFRRQNKALKEARDAEIKRKEEKEKDRPNDRGPNDRGPNNRGGGRTRKI